MTDLPPEAIKAGVDLAEIGVRTSASSIFARIKASKADKDKDRTISELEEIVRELIQDRDDALNAGLALKDELSARTIDDDELQFITDELVPAFEKLATLDEASDMAAEDVIDLIKSLVTKDLLSILQLVGFNFRAGIGQPLTDLTSRQISKVGAVPHATEHDLAIAQLRNQEALANLALDEEAYDRFTRLFS